MPAVPVPLKPEPAPVLESVPLAVQMMPEVASPFALAFGWTPGGSSFSAAASARACAPVSGPSERLSGGCRDETTMGVKI